MSLNNTTKSFAHPSLVKVFEPSAHVGSQPVHASEKSFLRAGEKEEVKKFVDNIWPPCPDTCPSRKGGECNSQLTRDALTFDLIEFVESVTPMCFIPQTTRA